MTTLETGRLTLRELATADAPFMLELLNDSAFIAFIGDRGVRTVEQAEAYLLAGAIASYERFGFGLYLVVRKGDGAPLGICGLVKRAALEDVDVGFALLPAYRGLGYAREAVRVVLADARDRVGLARVVAIVSPGNAPSRRLLEELGFRFERPVRMAPEESEIDLLAIDLAADRASVRPG